MNAQQLATLSASYRTTAAQQRSVGHYSKAVHSERIAATYAQQAAAMVAAAAPVAAQRVTLVMKHGADINRLVGVMQSATVQYLGAREELLARPCSTWRARVSGVVADRVAFDAVLGHSAVFSGMVYIQWSGVGW